MAKSTPRTFLALNRLVGYYRPLLYHPKTSLQSLLTCSASLLIATGYLWVFVSELRKEKIPGYTILPTRILIEVSNSWVNSGETFASSAFITIGIDKINFRVYETFLTTLWLVSNAVQVVECLIKRNCSSTCFLQALCQDMLWYVEIGKLSGRHIE